MRGIVARPADRTTPDGHRTSEDSRSADYPREGVPLTAAATPPHDQAPRPQATGGRKRPVVWMVITGVAVVAVIGLGVWALKVHSDLEASQSDLAAQTAATEAAQAQVAAQTEAAQAAAAELEKITAGNEVYVVSNEDVAQAESDVAAAQKALDEANAAVRRGKRRSDGGAGRSVEASRRTRAGSGGARSGTGRASAGESLRPRVARGDLGPREGR